MIFALLSIGVCHSLYLILNGWVYEIGSRTLLFVILMHFVFLSCGDVVLAFHLDGADFIEQFGNSCFKEIDFIMVFKALHDMVKIFGIARNILRCNIDGLEVIKL